MKRFSLQQKEAALLAQYDRDDRDLHCRKKIAFFIETERIMYRLHMYLFFIHFLGLLGILFKEKKHYGIAYSTARY